MPQGIVWLVVGIVIGAVAGWLFVDNFVAGGAAGFVIALALLLTGSWLGGRGEDDEEISISGR